MIEDTLGSAVCTACLACYVPWLREKWKRRTWLRVERPGYGMPVPVTGLHGAREADARRMWLSDEARRFRVPTYQEAVEALAANRRYERLSSGPIGATDEIRWHGPGGIVVIRPEMHAVIKP